MKILLVGEWSYKIYEEALSDSLISLGYEVVPYKYSSYFKTNKKFFLSKFFINFQNYFLVGPIIRRINIDILKIINKKKPDIIFLYRALHVQKRTIKLIKDAVDSPYVILYNNDNPFTSKYFSSRFFLSSVPISDLVLAYRSSNIKEFYDLGAKKVLLFMSAFHPKINFPSLKPNSREFDKKKKFDVVFVGHYEPDIRKEYLEEIIKRGISLRIFGSPTYWKKVQRKSKYLSKLPSIEVIDIDKYNEVISNSKIALCFFSKANKDNYTRRCFEIPAAKTLLLSEYSKFLSNIYIEDKEIIFFRNKNEMIKNIIYYLNNDNERKTIAENGFKRCLNDGHDIFSRTKVLMEYVRRQINIQNVGKLT